MELPGSNVLACETYSLRQLLLGGKLNVMEVPALLRKEGIKGVSFNERYFESRDAAYIDRLKAASDKEGRVVVALQADGNLALADEVKRKEQVVHYVESLRIAHRLKAPVLRINSGTTGKQENADGTVGVERVAAGIRAMLPLARELGVRIAIENHGGVSSTADNILRLIQSTDPEWVGVLADFGNFTPEGRYEDIARLAPHTLGTHVKVGKLNERGDVADYDLARVLGVLKQHNFRGALSIEYVGDQPPVEGIRTSRDLIVKYW